MYDGYEGHMLMTTMTHVRPATNRQAAEQATVMNMLPQLAFSVRHGTTQAVM